MFAGIVEAIVNGALKAAFGWLSDIMEKRGLIQQGREQQHSDDLSASVQQSKEAGVIRETVDAKPNSDLDAALERVRHDAASGNG